MASPGDKAAATDTETKDALPPLSDADFRAFNRMADKMDLFHNHFRQTWNLLYTACTTGKRPSSMTLRQFLTTGLSFADQLTAHHTIEERYVFPMLASRMPQFDPKKGNLIKQHEKIHHGLEDFQGYLLRCKNGEEDFEMDGLRKRMESWGEILWKHLDEEVEDLGAENMRKFWTKDEIRKMPM
ncbi:hypothetical protein NLU13_7385 [Sarocladium strictum]|uniref:Hemerythrin-like domain-containing protein n=1 Tax=Sarocladium strictum TaxID=5046 RepID=A0AA39GD09_SARSR|nr:hypothetical protein NLU13_7385 [Sarocladium strictum]